MSGEKVDALTAEYHQPDHWNYKTDPYELRKYDQTLALVPPGRYQKALEIGCSEGAFTRRIAPMADDVLGVDIVPVALERAQVECAEYSNVRFLLMNLDHDTLNERFDLIFCAEVLYYFRWTRLRPVARKVVSWLRPGGYLIAVHVKNDIAAGWEFGPKGAERTHPLFERPGIKRVREQDEGQYVLSLFQRVADVPTTVWQDRIEDLSALLSPAVAVAAARRALTFVQRSSHR
jgi:SAM-dependent methyltransferase